MKENLPNDTWFDCIDPFSGSPVRISFPSSNCHSIISAEDEFSILGKGAGVFI